MANSSSEHYLIIRRSVVEGKECVTIQKVVVQEGKHQTSREDCEKTHFDATVDTIVADLRIAKNVIWATVKNWIFNRQ